MGVTLFPLDGADPDTLIRHADQAMYLAKQGGRNRYTLFDAEHDRLSASRRESQQSILDAIARNQLRLYFQPKVNMRSGQVVGAEALIRWQHPARGLLDPAEFLPQVDLIRLHGPIGDWVLNNSLRLAEEWAQAGLHLVISINVAADQLQSVDFVTTLRDALARHPGVEPRNIELEILETAALSDPGKLTQVIEACSALGVGFTIDDFGTGYSSLTYLKQLQVDTLKIDQSFVQDMLEDPDDLSIVDSIVGLAAAFRRRVVAEVAVALGVDERVRAEPEREADGGSHQVADFPQRHGHTHRQQSSHPGCRLARRRPRRRWPWSNATIPTCTSASPPSAR